MTTTLRSLVAAATIGGALLCADASAMRFSGWGDAFRDGEVIANVRYRFESVEQDNALRDAEASTLRARLGYASDTTQPFSFAVDVEGVTAVGSERYNSGANGLTDFSAVLDDETTEVNQAYVMLRLDKTQISVGRRAMKLDNSRFLGDVVFRQNQQSYDSVVVMNTSLPGHRFFYAYMDEAHRFLGDDNPAGNLDMSSHFFNYRYKAPGGNALVLYAYFLEMDAPILAGRSTQTVGARFEGSADAGSMRWLYTLEYADQSPYADGNDTNDASYAFGEVGLRWPNQWVTRLGVEHMSGDGTYAYQTPLGANYLFGGLADLFAAATPDDGLVDRYVKLSAPIESFGLSVAYHDFVSDNDDLDYGTEWDVTLTRGFGERFSVTAQFADYKAEQFAVDTQKVWLFFGYRY